MLIAFLALIAMVNGMLGWVHTLPRLGWLPASHAADLRHGVRSGRLAAGRAVGRTAPTIGNLLGTRLVLNEFVAFVELGPLKAQLDPRSFTIATYALCGFANFSSIAIQIGGIGALAPTRKIGPGAARPEGRGGRHDGEFHVGLHRGHAAVIRRSQATTSRAAPPCGRRSAWCWAADWARSPTNSTERVEIPYAEIPGWPQSTAVGHAGKLVIGKLGGLDRGGDGRPRASVRRLYAGSR